jgi:chromosome segregation ATPase
MKLMKCALGGVAAVSLAVGGLYLLGYGTTLRTAGKMFDDGINAAKSPEFLIKEAEVAIDDLKEKAVQHALTLKDVQRQAEAAQKEVAALSKKRSEELALLVKDKEALASSQDTFKVGGKELSKKDIGDGAKKRLAMLKELEGKLTFKQKELEQLTTSAENGEKALEAVKVAIAQKRLELDAMSQRIKNAEQMARVRELTEKLDSSALNTNNSVVSKNLKELQKRLDELDLRNGGLDTAKPADWKADEPADSTLKEIDSFLKETKGDDKPLTASK